MIIIPLKQQSKPEMTEAIAVQTMQDLKEAFEAESADRVLSFVAEDATVAGKDITSIRNLLRQAFQYMKTPVVTVSNVKFDPEGADKCHVTAQIGVVDKNPGDSAEHKYSGQMGFEFERRQESHLFGLANIYRWKIVKVETSTPIPTSP